MTASPTWKQRFEHLATEYGKIAIVTYFALFGLVLAGFVAALQMGVAVESTAGEASLLGAAYLATKLTQPLRIGATLVLTPLVARVVRRGRAAPVASRGLAGVATAPVTWTDGPPPTKTPST